MIKKIILFDLNGTILHQIRSERSHIAYAYSAFCLHQWNVSFEDFEIAWLTIIKIHEEQFREGREFLHAGHFELAKVKLREPWFRESVAAVLSQLGCESTDRLIESISWAYQDSWAGGLVMPSDNLRVLRYLKEDGYHLGIVTNFQQPDLLPRFLDRFGLTNLFDVIIVSATAGYRKPHPDLFRLALARFDITDSCQAIPFVGDSEEEDVEGALLAGLCPIRIHLQQRTISLNNRVLRIRTLADLPECLHIYFHPMSAPLALLPGNEVLHHRTNH